MITEQTHTRETLQLARERSHRMEMKIEALQAVEQRNQQLAAQE